MLSWQSQNKTIITKSDEWLQIKVYLESFLQVGKKTLD